MEATLFLLLISYAYIAAGFIGCLFFSFFKKKWLAFLAPILLAVAALIFLVPVYIVEQQRLAEMEQMPHIYVADAGLVAIVILPLFVTTTIWSILIYFYRKNAKPGAYTRAYSLISVFRFLIYLLVGRRKVSQKSSKEITDIMERYRKLLIADDRLSNDLTEGTHPVEKKSAQRLVDAFVATRQNKDEEDFCIQVAQHWIRGLEKTIHKISLAVIILFLLLWVSGIFLVSFIDGILGFVYLLGITIFPILGLVFALLGRGWKKWLLLGANVFNIFVALMIIL